MDFATSTIITASSTVFTFTDSFLDFLNFQVQLELLLFGIVIFFLAGILTLLIFK